MNFKYALWCMILLFTLNVSATGDENGENKDHKKKQIVELQFDVTNGIITGDEPMPFDVPFDLVGNVDSNIKKIEILYIKAKYLDGYVPVNSDGQEVQADEKLKESLVIRLNDLSTTPEFIRKEKTTYRIKKKKRKSYYKDRGHWLYAGTQVNGTSDSNKFRIRIQPLSPNSEYVFILRLTKKISASELKTEFVKVFKASSASKIEIYSPYDFQDNDIIKKNPKKSELEIYPLLIADYEKHISDYANREKKKLTSGTKYLEKVVQQCKEIVKNVARSRGLDTASISDDKLTKLVEKVFNPTTLGEFLKLDARVNQRMIGADGLLNDLYMDGVDMRDWHYLKNKDNACYESLSTIYNVFARFDDASYTYPVPLLQYYYVFEKVSNISSALLTEMKDELNNQISSVTSCIQKIMQLDPMPANVRSDYESRLGLIQSEIDKIKKIQVSVKDTLKAELNDLKRQLESLENDFSDINEDYRIKIQDELILPLRWLISDLYNAVDAMEELKKTFEAYDKYWTGIVNIGLNDAFSANSVPVAGYNSTIGDYMTRAKHYISADFGFAGFKFRGIKENDLYDRWTIQPYLGVNFNLFPINKDAPYGLFSRGYEYKGRGYGYYLFRGASIMLGLTVDARNIFFGDDAGDDSYFMGTYNKNNTLITGLGLRLSDNVRFSFGRAWYRTKFTDVPSVESPYKLVSSCFVSLSLDWDVRSFTGKLGELISDKFK